MSKIITLSAKAEHGKDLTATILKDKLEYLGKKVLIIHYADYLKYICKQYFGWDGNKDEKGRTILQQIGTEKVRTRNLNFWVELIEMFIDVFDDDFDYFLIPDTRFPNEINYLKDFGWDVISLHIERIGFENHLTPEQRLHLSEIALDNFTFDYYLKSLSGEGYLQMEVNKFVEYLNGGNNE